MSPCSRWCQRLTMHAEVCTQMRAGVSASASGPLVHSLQVTARVQGLGGHPSALDVQPGKDHLLAIGCGDGTIRLVQWLPGNPACLPHSRHLLKQPAALPSSTSNGGAQPVPQAGADVQPKGLHSQLPDDTATTSKAELLTGTGAAPEGSGGKPGSAADPKAVAQPLTARSTAVGGVGSEAGSAAEAVAEVSQLTTTGTALSNTGTSASLTCPDQLLKPPGLCLEPAEAPSVGQGLTAPIGTSHRHQTPGTAESSAAQAQPPQLERWQQHADRLLRVGIPDRARVLCLQWHPTRAALLAFGCSDGTVGLLDAARHRIGLAPTQHPAGVTHLCWCTDRSSSSGGGTAISNGNWAAPSRGSGTSGHPGTAAASAAAELCSDAGAALTPGSRRGTSDASSAAAAGSAVVGLGSGTAGAIYMGQRLGSEVCPRAIEDGTSAAGMTAEGYSKQAGAAGQKGQAATPAGMAGAAQNLDMLVSLCEDGCLLQWAALPAVLATKPQAPAGSAGNKGSAAASRHSAKAAGAGSNAPHVGCSRVVLRPGEYSRAVATAGQAVEHTPRCLSWSPHAHLLAVGCSSGVIQLCAPTAAAAAPPAPPPGPAASGLQAASWRAPGLPGISMAAWEVRHVLPAHQQAVQCVAWHSGPSRGRMQLSALLPPTGDCCSLWSGLDQPEQQLAVLNAVPAPALLSAAADGSIALHRQIAGAQGVWPREAGWQSAVHELRSPASVMAVHPGSLSVVVVGQLRAIQVGLRSVPLAFGLVAASQVCGGVVSITLVFGLA